MKTTAQQACLAIFLGLLPVALGQTPSNGPGPSPTQSVDCEAHGDHWHCEGPLVTSATGSPAGLSSAVPTVPAGHDEEHDHDHDHDHDDEAHDHDDEAHDHDDEASDHDEYGHTGEASLGPSPTQSAGCEAHGDHWHCGGAASSTLATSVSSSVSEVPSGVSTVGTSGAAGVGRATWFIVFGTVFAIARTI